MNKKIIIIFLLLICLSSCAKKNEYIGELNVLNWSSYIPDDIINDFEDEYNIKVNYGTYSSNEELLAKVTSSKKGTYDLIFPSDYMVEIMKDRNLIDKLDSYKLNNISNINDLFLNLDYDVNNEYSLPFLSTTIVIAVNRNNIKDDINGYNDLLNKNYKNNIVLLDDQRIIIGASLLANKYEMSETNSKKLDIAKKWLLELKKNIKAFDSDSPKTFLITNEVDIGIMWNAEAILAKKYNDNIEIIYPNEGSALSTDNYCLLKGTKNKDNAYLFIDYLLKDDISKRIIDEYPYISPNKNLNQYTEEQLSEILDNSYFVKNIGENISKYDKLWAEIK